MKHNLFHMTDEEYEALNPPLIKFGFIRGKLFQEVIDDDDWIGVGYIPKPKTRFGWFLYHFIHGIAMGYRFLPVLLFSITEARHGDEYQEVIW